MSNFRLTQTGTELQADLNKVEGLANIKTIGTGLTLSEGGEISANGGGSYTTATEAEVRALFGNGTTTPTLISFTVQSMGMGGTFSYQAEEGMTWAQWVASAYNTNEFVLSGNRVLTSGGIDVTLNSSTVLSSDTIIDGTEYVVSGGGAN